MGPRIGSLFTGAAGLDLAVEKATGGRMVWHAEADPRIGRILDHHRAYVPNLGDVTYADWPDVHPIDILTGGTPCQDLSIAGKRKGMSPGTRSNLWAIMREAIAYLRPPLVIWENVHGALSAPAESGLEHCPRCMGDERPVPLRALGRVLGDLADLGYDARWGCVRASDVGAPHKRSRIFVAAYPTGEPRLGRWLTTPQETARWRPLDVAQGRGRTRRLPTPRVTDRRGAADHGTGGPDLRTAVRLLPTPAVNDMGREKTVEEWDAWTDTMLAKHDNGNGHGPSLSVEVRRSGSVYGVYGAAVRHWEEILRPAPPPTETIRGHRRLNTAFSEWMLGFDEGWITKVPGVAHVSQHRALGNACSPQQAHLALTLLLRD